MLTEFAGAARLGEGAALTLEGIRRVVPDAVPDVVLLRLRPGPARAALLRELPENPPANLYPPTKPSDLVAAVPARLAARTAPSSVLRTE